MLENFKNLSIETFLMLASVAFVLKVNALILNLIGFLICIFITLHIALTYQEQLKIIKAWIYGLLKWRDRQKVASECEGKINLFSKKIGSELIGKEFPKVKIRLVTGEEEDYFENGNFIIRVKDSGNPNKNLLIVALRFFSKTLIPETKQYLHNTLVKSIDFFSVKRFLDENAERLNSLFYEEYYYPECQKEPKIKECFGLYGVLDNVGIFNRVFLQELIFLGRKAHFLFEPDDPKITGEVVALLNFLKNIAGKERGEDAVSGLTFTGKILRTGVVLVAGEEKMILGDSNPFIWRVNNHLEKGIENIYLMAWGKNIDFLKVIAHDYLDKDPRIENIKEQSYLIKDGKLKAFLVLYKKK